ncbi:MAG: aldehyde dehydrogenase family protein, partial [Verrucomicrobiota bacterium]
MAKQSAKVSASNSSLTATLKALGLEASNPGVFDGEWSGSGKVLQSFSPNDGKLIGEVRTATVAEYERALERAAAAFKKWQTIPAPQRGEVIRQLGNALRDAKKDLGMLVTLEAGKIIAE